MEIRDIRYALASLDCGGFAQAAKGMYVSRQAISQSVHRLEGELGASLFEVINGNRLIPTSTGQRFFAKSRPVLAAFDGLAAEFGIASTPSPTTDLAPSIAIAVSTGVTMALHGRLLEDLRALLPGLIRNIEESNTEGSLDYVRNGEVDLALVGSHPRYLSEFDYEPLLLTGLWLAVPPDSPLYERESISIEDLQGQRVVTAGHLNHLHRFVLEECQRVGVQPLIPASSSNIELLRKLSLEHNAMVFVFPESYYSVSPRTSFDLTNTLISKQGWNTVSLIVDGGDKFGTYAIRSRTRASNATARRLWAFLKSEQAKNMAHAITEA